MPAKTYSPPAYPIERMDLIAAELAAVVERFEEELGSDLPCVNELTRHVSRFRGKMLRPTLVFLCGRAIGELTPAHITVATVVEMVHMATLVHDDVLDEAAMRRRGATINRLRGNEAAVMLGDYLISHSYHLCASLTDPVVARAIARTTNQVCEGELLQLHNRGNLELDEETYITIISRKTASLIAVSCYLGAKLAGADDAAAKRLEKYGLSLGIAFQIQDDILDITGEERKVGKTLGIDIEKRKLTLPVIHFLQHAPAEHQELCRSLLGADEPRAAERIRKLIMPSGSIAYAHDRARRLVGRAKQGIAELPESEAKQRLIAMAEFVVERSL
ncbi:MAG: polyprenyl synthetase family protein [Burkholderiales bacterium]|nr:polyprenyl synthetase family protein [Phycisphaerae bacterium]